MVDNIQLPERVNGDLRPEDSKGWWTSTIAHGSRLLSQCSEYTLFAIAALAVISVASYLSKPENMWAPFWLALISFFIVGGFLYINEKK
jgi:hypothetical protein